MARGAVGRTSSAWLIGAGPWFFAGCGGGSALMHTAQTLPVDSVSVGAGVSGQFGSSAVNDAIDRGRSAAGQSLDVPAAAHSYAQGVLTEALLAPGASPW